MIGAPNSVDMVRIENFLTRNALPHHTLDPATDPEAREVIARYAPKPGDLPLVVAPDGEVLRNPDDTALAHVIGMLERSTPTSCTTSRWSAAAPRGLSTAVYAGSEGLSVVVLEQRACMAARPAPVPVSKIISASRPAYRAWRWSAAPSCRRRNSAAEIIMPVTITQLDCRRTDGAFVLDTGEGSASAHGAW